MRLFQCTDIVPDTVTAPAIIITPLGHIQLQVAINGLNVTDTAPSETLRLPSGGYIACWHRPDFDLELLMCHPITSKPADMELTDCWAGLWRLQTHQTIETSIFSAVWKEGYKWKDGGPNSGEWLYAKTWDDRQTEVSIGTEDGDALARRAHLGEGIPNGWESYFHSSPDQLDWFSLHMIHYEVGNAGVPIPLPPLMAGQQCQIHFAVAWSPYAEGGSANWFAVDISDKEILVSSNCS